MSENIGVSLKKGHHRLNGKELLGYARFRHDEEGDFELDVNNKLCRR